MGEILIAALRRKFKAREGAVAHSPENFMYEFGDVVSALLYSALFVPDFLEVDNSVLINFGRADQAHKFVEAKKKSKMTLSALESSFNFVEVPYLFSNRDSTDDEDKLLSETIAEAWRGRLKTLYPTRTFVVSPIGPNSTGSIVGVHFFELR